MQKPEHTQNQMQEIAAGALKSTHAHRKMTEERCGATERELTKFKALSEVFQLCESSLVQHRNQVASAPNPSLFAIEGLDAAIEELRRLQRQTQEFALKNEGALHALRALEDAFKQEAAQTLARIQEATALGAPSAVPEPPEEPEDPEVEDSLGILEDFGAEENAKEPIAQPKRGAPRKPK